VKESFEIMIKKSNSIRNKPEIMQITDSFHKFNNIIEKKDSSIKYNQIDNIDLNGFKS